MGNSEWSFSSRFGIVLLLLGIGGSSLVLAQGPQDVDPPSRVARLNWMTGAVSFQPAGVETWTNATLNFPLTTGDHIYSDDHAAVEMHVGRNAIRLGEFTNFGYLNLTDRVVQMRFTEGAMEVRLRDLEDDDSYEIDTPQGAITLLRSGDYRVDCDPNRNVTMVTVRAGEAEVTSNGQAFPVHPRETGFFSSDQAAEVREANQLDGFDRFTEDRNRMEERPRPHEYVPPTMVGSEDLYTYGQWRTWPDYGSVWVPPVEANWSPYRYGHWAWVEPWGWTWIDDAPWGFAPFHYGRWAHVDIGWIWVPGPVAVRPVYAPALVAFVGGPHFSLSFRMGAESAAVAWFPLGPREVYRPSYHVSNTYVNQVNVTNVRNVNVTNVNVTYVNQTVPGAVTAVPQNAFVSREPVHRVMQPVSSQMAAQAQVVGAAPPVAPQRASLVGTAPANVPRPPAALMQRALVSRQTPPPAPVPFQEKQQALAQNPGRPVDPQTLQSLRAQQGRPPAQDMPVRTGSPIGGRPSPAYPVPATPAPPTGSRPERMDSRPPNARGVINPPAPPPASPAPQPFRPPQPESTAPRAPAQPAPTPGPLPQRGRDIQNQNGRPNPPQAQPQETRGERQPERGAPNRDERRPAKPDEKNTKPENKK